jgi:hypothetical protein
MAISFATKQTKTRGEMSGGWLSWGWLVDLILREALLDHSPVVRRNGGAWLLSLLVASKPFLNSCCLRAQAETLPTTTPATRQAVRRIGSVDYSDQISPVVARLPLFQRAFLGLLFERQSDLAKEVAALGLAKVAQSASCVEEGLVQASCNNGLAAAAAVDPTVSSFSPLGLRDELLKDLVDAFQQTKASSSTFAPLSTATEDGDDDSGSAMTTNEGPGEDDEESNAASLGAMLNAVQRAQESFNSATTAAAAPAPAPTEQGRRREVSGGGGGGRDQSLDLLFASLSSSSSSDGSSLSHGGVYAELVDMAMAMGRPQLLYTFLSVVNAHPIWATCQLAVRCVVAARGGVGDKLASVAASHVPPGGGSGETWEVAFLPRLFRLRFDPNPHTASVMQRLW